MVWPFTKKPAPPPVLPMPSLVTGGTRMTPYEPGQGRVMVTDGGPHDPAAWAQITAQHIAPLNPALGGERYLRALKLQAAIAEAMIPHHAKVQETERGNLAESHEHLLNPLDAAPHIDEAVNAIMAASAGTEWEEHFASAEVQAQIEHELGVHFRSVQHIERSWHVDRHAHIEEFQTWANAVGLSLPGKV